MALLAFVVNLTTRWQHLHWFKIWSSGGASCIGATIGATIGSASLPTSAPSLPLTLPQITSGTYSHPSPPPFFEFIFTSMQSRKTPLACSNVKCQQASRLAAPTAPYLLPMQQLFVFWPIAALATTKPGCITSIVILPWVVLLALFS